MAANKKIKAAVFDLDGMLLDTREQVFRAYEHAFDTHGHPYPPRDLVAQQVGKPTLEAFRNLVEDTDYEGLINAHYDFLDKNPDLIKEYAGLHVMLEKLKVSGVMMAVLTSRKTAFKLLLDNAGISKYFEVIVDASMTTKGKPDPEGLLLALDNLGVRPEQAAMLGDAVMDVKTGKNAKVALTIGITHGFGTREALEKVRPDYIVDNLYQIPPILLAS